MPRKIKRKPLTKIPASEPEARDAGPRLLPLGEPDPRIPSAEQHLELADIALGIEKREPKKAQSRKPEPLRRHSPVTLAMEETKVQ